MFAAITRGVIHSLQQSPPDIEALRVYLLLPECSVYQQEEHYDAIVIPFSEAILRLSANAGKVLSESLFTKQVLSSINDVKISFNGGVAFLWQCAIDSGKQICLKCHSYVIFIIIIIIPVYPLRSISRTSSSILLCTSSLLMLCSSPRSSPLVLTPVA